MAITTFIPTLWSARLLAHLDNALVAKNFFNTDYEGEISDQGDTVRINQIGAVNIFDYQRNQDMAAPEELSTAAQDLVIDQANAFNFQIDDIDRVQMRADLMDSAMERSAYALADKEDTYLFGELATNAGNKIGATAIANPEDMFSLLVQLRTLLTKSNVPTIGRRVGVPPEAVGYLLEDTRFTGTGGAFAEGTLQTGLIGRALGFDIYEVNTLPGNNTIIAGHTVAATYANQIVKTEAFRMEKRFADGLKGLNVYGARVLIPEALATAEVSFS